MKTILRTCLLASLAIQTSHAATMITVTDADLDPDAGQFGTSSVGTLGRTETITDGAGPQDLTYEITGLTLDDIGSGDDSVTVTFTATTEGAVLNSGADNASQGFLVSGGSWLNADGEFVQLQYSNMTVNISGGSDNGFGEFLGFTALAVQSFTDDGDIAFINGVQKEFGNGDTSPFAIANEDYVKLEYQASGQDPVTTGYRMHTWDFELSVSAVPEPSSTALLGLGGLALMLRRKRS
jgi:hypothetical protein